MGGMHHSNLTQDNKIYFIFYNSTGTSAGLIFIFFPFMIEVAVNGPHKDTFIAPKYLM